MKYLFISSFDTEVPVVDRLPKEIEAKDDDDAREKTKTFGRGELFKALDRFVKVTEEKKEELVKN